MMTKAQWSQIATLYPKQVAQIERLYNSSRMLADDVFEMFYFTTSMNEDQAEAAADEVMAILV